MKRWLSLIPGFLSAFVLVGFFAIALASQPHVTTAAPAPVAVEKAPTEVCPQATVVCPPLPMVPAMVDYEPELKRLAKAVEDLSAGLEKKKGKKR